MGAFKNCENLKNIYIPAGVKKIDVHSFMNCKALKMLALDPVTPPAVETTFEEDNPFAGAGVECIRVLPGCKTAYQNDTYWKTYAGSITEDSYDAMSITVSQTGGLEKAAMEQLGTKSSREIDDLKIVTGEGTELDYLKDIAYLQTHFLNAVKIDLSEAHLDGDGEGGSKLKSDVFRDRANLKMILLPDDTINIARNAFANCGNLKKLVIPGSIEKFGESPFYGCDSLTSLVIERETPPLHNDGDLGGSGLKNIIVPVGCESEYEKDAFWHTYNIIAQRAISLSAKSVSLESLKKTSLTAKVIDYRCDNDVDDYASVLWSVSNPGVISVSASTGRTVAVTALSPGTAVVTAKTADGRVTAACTVTVKGLPAPKAQAASAGYKKNKVTWSGVSGAAGYEIYRSTKKTSGYAKIRTLSSGYRSYTDTGRVAGTTCYYKVRAYKKDAAGVVYRGSYSSIASAKPVPAKVTGIKASRGGSGKIKVTWKKVSGASGYTVYRSAKKSSGFKAVKTCKSGKSVKYVTGKLKKGKRCYFKVKAYRIVKKKKVYGNYSAAVSYKVK